MSKTPKKIEDLRLGKSPNLGTALGAEVLERSIREHGMGRGIVVDKDGVVIAGNKVLEAAKAAGVKKIRVVQTTGDQLVAVRRKDLDLAGKDMEAAALGVLDNRAGELNLFYDQSVLAAIAGETGVNVSRQAKERTKKEALFMGCRFGEFTLRVPNKAMKALIEKVFAEVGASKDAVVEHLSNLLKLPKP